MSQYCSSLPSSLHQHVGAVASTSRCRATCAAATAVLTWPCSSDTSESVPKTSPPSNRRRRRPSSTVIQYYQDCLLTNHTRSFSSSTRRATPPALDSQPTPVTYATPAKSPQGPTSWWHRAFSFSTHLQQPPHHPIHQHAPHTQPITHTASANPPSSSTTVAKSSSQESAPSDCPHDINTLMQRPDIFDNITPPRNPIVLCHGLYGFDVRGPFLGLEIHYWAVVLDILRKKIGADVIVRGVPGTGSIAQRAKVLHNFLKSDEAGVKGKKLNFIGHSMGGLDARYLISHLKPQPDEYTPVSLTTISTPHKGSPFMDWCNANVGIGRDYVEDAIKEYNKAVEAASISQERSESSEDPEIENMPYSLKTPLFVRPKKDAKLQDSIPAEKAKTVSADSSVDQPKAAPTPHPPMPRESHSSKESPSLDPQSQAQSSPTAASSKQPDSNNNNNNNNSSSSGSSALKSITSLGFVTPLTRALSSLTGNFSSYMLSVLDTPAYAMLSTRYMSKVFNPSTPDSPHVAYFSIAARTRKIPLWHPLWLPKVILDVAAESRTVGAERDGSAAALGDPEKQGNDGLVSVQSAKWGQFLGVIEQKDHWDLRGSGAPRWGLGDKLNPATGKPWAKGKAPAADQKSKEEAEKVFAQSASNGSKDLKDKDKGSDESWLAINRLLGGLIGSKTQAKEEDRSAGPDDAAASNQQSSAGTSSADSDIQSALASAAETAKDILKSDDDAGKSNSKDSDDKKSVTDTVTENMPEFVDEVAEWISDRLPQGSAERRKLANEAAQQQEADLRERTNDESPPRTIEAARASADFYEPTWAGSDVYAEERSIDKSSASPTASTPSANTDVPVSLGSSPTVDVNTAATSPAEIDETPEDAEETKSRRYMLKLQREVEWLESQGKHGDDDKVRALRREIEWHRQEHLKRFGSSIRANDDELQQRPVKKARLDDDTPEAQGKDLELEASTKKVKDKDKDKERGDKDKEELERFWIALCQHLYLHGY